MVTHCPTPTTCHSGKGNTMETVKRSVVARGKAGGVTGKAQRMGHWRHSADTTGGPCRYIRPTMVGTTSSDPEVHWTLFKVSVGPSLP